MLQKIVFFIFFFYFLVLIQTSFLAHFSFFGLAPNLVLLAVFLINLFSDLKWPGFTAAFIAGFYLDIFSIGANIFFGFYTLISIMIFLFLKLISRYVQIPLFKRVQQ